MQRRLRAIILCGLLALALAAPAAAVPSRIKWEDMGDATGSGVNGKILGREIELTGYLLPVDREGSDVHSFLLVPVAGACSHMPTPPPNQLVLVTLPQPFVAAEIYQPVKVTGILGAEHTRSQLFILDGVKVVDSAYALGAAHVAEWADAPQPTGLGNPLLNRKPVRTPATPKP